ncbi:hypothetical protein X474_06430 [Dethiosulfatarculus sandiegensis]|uniref:Uncharacterized protein n=1 Tax=Dethiosulfatarculus sandiegensis TaxID=1429043 RepID=A0A0D2JYY9_9BACT|nr:hypothetical protein X474_06430 [Dethiosulfatarculus sandiegensis]
MGPKIPDIHKYAVGFTVQGEEFKRRVLSIAHNHKGIRLGRAWPKGENKDNY